MVRRRRREENPSTKTLDKLLYSLVHLSWSHLQRDVELSLAHIAGTETHHAYAT
jgi:hypothetical protein